MFSVKTREKVVRKPREGSPAGFGITFRILDSNASVGLSVLIAGL